MLVVDASVAVRACGSPGAFGPLGTEELFAPPLMWSEFASAVHSAVWRRDITGQRAQELLSTLRQSPLREARHPELLDEAWRIADELGWARTYDAEYVALARLMDCRLVTSDGRLRRGADRLGLVVTPAEL